MKTRILTGSAIAVLIFAACGSESAPITDDSALGTSPTPSASSRDVGGCPITVPPQPAFVPPKPYPPEAPDLYQSVWYGTADLWTMLSPDGEIWQALPEKDGLFTQKIIWWSEDHNLKEEQRPTFTLTGRRLDGPGSFETGGPAGGGYRRDIGNFIMLGIEIPSGCWELTATYRDTELSHVVLVDG